MKKQQQPDSGIHDNTCPLSMCVPIFNLLGLTVPEKYVTKNFHRLRNDNHRMTRVTEGQGKSRIAPTFSKQGYKNTASLSKNIFSSPNFFMHICNMYATYLKSIEKIQ